MTWLGEMRIKTIIIAGFAAISILTAVFGLLGMNYLVVASAVLGLAVGIAVASGIGNQLEKLSIAVEKMGAGETDEIEIRGSSEIEEIAESLRKSAGRQKELADALHNIAAGNFAFDVKLRNEKDQVGKALQTCIRNGRNLQSEVGRIAEAAMAGKLRDRCSDETFRGAHSNLVNSVNTILDALVRVPGKAIKVMTRVVEGDLTARITGDHSGDHAAFQNALNLTIKTLDDALARVGLAAEQVSTASYQISAGSQTLSQKASEQASSIEQVSSSLHEVAAMTKQNSENAKEARRLSRVAETSVDHGVESMQRLSEAIDRIKTSSDSTAKIIKTIDEIAFQTNLLALNAAVEAARAGDAGKGFAVVAEEVRNLAMRSAEAAKNTANLIEESVKNSESGVALNHEVLENLKEINGHVKQVGAVMAEIAEASEQQTIGVDQVNGVIAQMNVVTQQVAANAEESASGAEELSGQAEELKGMVNAFKLSRNAGSSARGVADSQQRRSAPKAAAVSKPPKPVPLEALDSLPLSDF